MTMRGGLTMQYVVGARSSSKLVYGGAQGAEELNLVLEPVNSKLVVVMTLKDGVLV